MTDEPMPAWAIGTTDSYRALGAQLCTRDGRKCGNAVLLMSIEKFNLTVYSVVTDAGSSMCLTEGELAEYFYQPKWIMDPMTHPGVVRLSLD